MITIAGLDGLLDQSDAGPLAACGDLHELEREVAIPLFVELPRRRESLRNRSPGRSGLDEALVADQEDHRHVYALRRDSIDLTGKQMRRGEREVGRRVRPAAARRRRRRWGLDFGLGSAGR
jgi:hypothetical protein